MHTCTGFLLSTWNASALIDKNLRNFLVSIFSSSSACFTYKTGKMLFRTGWEPDCNEHKNSFINEWVNLSQECEEQDKERFHHFRDVFLGSSRISVQVSLKFYAKCTVSTAIVWKLQDNGTMEMLFWVIFGKINLGSIPMLIHSWFILELFCLKPK